MSVPQLVTVEVLAATLLGDLLGLKSLLCCADTVKSKWPNGYHRQAPNVTAFSRPAVSHLRKRAVVVRLIHEFERGRIGTI